MSCYLRCDGVRHQRCEELIPRQHSTDSRQINGDGRLVLQKQRSSNVVNQGDFDDGGISCTLTFCKYDGDVIATITITITMTIRDIENAIETQC